METPTGRGGDVRNVAVVITARASYARCRTALAAIKAHPRLKLHLLAGASAVLKRYGDVATFIEQDGFPLAARIHSLVEGENLIAAAKSTGLGVIELATALDNLRPDLVVTIADRFETLATAVAAAYMNIPLAHIQGGEITGSIDEKVRHAVTKLADLHLVASRRAAERVIRMGEDPARVFVTGCPSIDLAAEAAANPELDFDPFEKYGGVGPRLDLSGGYLLVLQHPVTTQCGEARRQVTETLSAVARLGLPTLWFWPNADAGSDRLSNGIRAFRELKQPENISFFKHIDSLDFLKLARHSLCIVGNSSVAIRECAFLGVPAVNIGMRQRGRDRGRNVMDVDHDRREIEQAVRRQIAHGAYPSDPIYGRGDAGRRIAEVLAAAPLGIDKELKFHSIPGSLPQAA